MTLENDIRDVEIELARAIESVNYDGEYIEILREELLEMGGNPYYIF